MVSVAQTSAWITLSSGQPSSEASEAVLAVGKTESVLHWGASCGCFSFGIPSL